MDGCVHVYAWMHVYAYMYVYGCMDVCMDVYVYIRVYVCVHICYGCVCMYTCVYVCYGCMDMCRRIPPIQFIYVYVCIYTIKPEYDIEQGHMFMSIYRHIHAPHVSLTH